MLCVLAVLLLTLPGFARAGGPTAAGENDPGILGAGAVGVNRLANFDAEGDNLIRLLVGAFDPLADPLPVQPGTALVDDAALAPDAPQYWLVQVRDQRFAAAQAAIRAAGATVAGYIHDGTYAVRATPAQRAAIAASPAVRWTGYYQPSWRFAPTVGDVPGLLDVEGEQTYRVSIFRVEPDRAATLAAIAAVPGVEVLEAEGRAVRVRGTATQVPLLAAVPAVEWVGGDFQAELLNADARWVIDTAVRDLQSATRATRLTGAGQTAGVADTGVNYIPDRNGRAHVAFRDCSAESCKDADYVQAVPGTADEELHGTVATGSGHRKMAAYFDLGRTGPNMYDESSHGTHTAGSTASDAGALGTADGHDGMAPGARLVHQNVADDTGGLGGLPADVYELFRQAYRPRDPESVRDPADDEVVTDDAGYVSTEDARTHNNSWGGPTSLGIDLGESVAVDEFMWDHEDMTIVFSAGNAGPNAGTMSYPASSKNALTSGASSNGRQPMVSFDSMANFSSHGPTADGRYGVDLATPGETIISPKGGTESDYHTAQGTSMSAPVLTGAATLVRQYFYDGFGPSGGEGFAGGRPDAGRRWNPSAALVTATLVNGATRMRGEYTGDEGDLPELKGQYPSAGQGFGLVNLDRSLYFDDAAGRDPINNFYLDVYRRDADAFQVSEQETGTRTFQLEAEAGQPLEVTLAWTDAPNLLPLGTPALVNNLDLVVTDPDGEELFGNSLNTRSDPAAEEADSVPGQPDQANNLEKVRIAEPKDGTYTVTITAPPIAVGPQGFAIAASGDIAPAGGSFDGGPALLRDVPGTPTIDDLKVTPVSADLTKVTFTTSEPTTASVTLPVDGEPTTYNDVYKTGPDGYQGRPGGQPDESSPEYSDVPALTSSHEVYVAGLSPGESYAATVEVVDMAQQKATAPASFTSPANVYQPLAEDTGFFGMTSTGANWGSSGSAKQMYAGHFEDEELFGAFMFRVPESVDPSKLIGASVELTAAHDWANRYNVDPVFSVELIDDSVEPLWGELPAQAVRTAPAAARANPETTMREGGLTGWSFGLTCNDLGALKENLAASGGERKAAFRFIAENIDTNGIVSAEFGYNRRSRGLEHRPKLVLHFAPDDAPPLGGCDPDTPAPTITDVGIHPGMQEESMTVSWKTDVDSTSTVLFREKGATEFTQVGTLARTTVHQVQVKGLDETKDYEFAVRSAACNGATTTADNNGKGWDFFRAPADPGPATEVAAYDWESDDQGWTKSLVDRGTGVSPLDGEWVRGGPGADGTANGQHVSPYSDEEDVLLTSPPLNVAGNRVAVEFAARHNLEQVPPGLSTTDALKLEYSTDGVVWTPAASYQGLNPSYPAFDAMRVEFDVPSGPLRLRFNVTSDANTSTPPYEGAGVDQVKVLSYSVAPTGDGTLPLVGPVPPPSADASGFDAAGVPTRLSPTDADRAAGTAVCAPLPPATSGKGKKPKKR